jgi:two-component system copper resistance phosphate regulon response regulator CusR
MSSPMTSRDIQESFTGISKNVKKILIVDDEPYIAVVLNAILRKNFNCEVKVTSGVGEGTALLQSYTPDLAILDINLGDGTGYDLLPVIKDRNKETKVVMMSAKAGEAEHRKMKENNIELFVEKPFTKEKIVDSLRSLQLI